MQWSTLLSASLRRLSETCDALSLLFSQGVLYSSVPASKLYMPTYLDRPEQLAVNHRYGGIFSFR